MHQVLKIYSQEGLHEKRQQLESLDVAECEATRLEDKMDIMAKIHDVSAFNEKLRSLLLNEQSGLLTVCAGRAGFFFSLLGELVGGAVLFFSA